MLLKKLNIFFLIFIIISLLIPIKILLSQPTEWQNIGPFMGYINSMAMDNAHPDTVYAATLDGLYRSFNGAENWSLMDLQSPEREINKVIISNSHPNNILCASEYNIYQSTDYGDTWETILSDTVRITCIEFNPDNPRTIIVGTDNRHTISGYHFLERTKYIKRSTDGGVSWKEVSFNGVNGSNSPVSIKYIIIDPSDTTKIYVGSENQSSDGGILVSHNNGVDWIQKRLTTFSNENIYALICTPVGYENHTLYAITDGYGIDRQLCISKDAGITWYRRSAPSSFKFGGNIRDNAIYISADYPENVYIGAEYNNGDLHSSIVGYNIEKESWYHVVDAPHTYPTSILTCNEVDYLGFRYNGVYKYSSEDETWNLKQKGMNNVEIYDFALFPNDPNKLLVAIPDNLVKTTDRGKNWTITDHNFSCLTINDQNPSIIFAGSKPGYYLNFMDPFYCYESEDGGDSWKSHKLFTRSGLSDYSYKMWNGDIMIFPNDPEKILVGVDGGGGCGEGLYKSTDGGDSWHEEYNTGVSTIAMDPTNNDIVYLGTTNLGYVSRSEDGGNSWTLISPSYDNAFVYNVWDLDVDKNDQVFAATSSGLFKWGGNENWTLVKGFPTTNTTAIVINNHPEPPEYYVGTSGDGIFFSNDGGLTWTSYNNGLKKLSITKLVIGKSNLFAGTINGGVWSTDLLVGIDDEKVSIPTEYNLLQNYPNPFNPTTAIRYSIPEHSNVTIKVFDVLGRKVSTIVNKSLLQGNYEVEWDASELTSGIYFYRMQAGEFVESKKMILLR